MPSLLSSITMITKTILLIISTVLITFPLTACVVSRHPAGIASSTSPISPAYTVLAAVEDSSCNYWLFALPLIPKDSTDDIITKLIKRQGADALVGVTIEYERASFAYPVIGSDCTVIKGLAVKNIR